MSHLQRIATSIIIVLFSTILLLDLFVHPEYSYDDSPYFEYRGILFGLAMALGAFIVFIAIEKIGCLFQWHPLPPIVLYVVVSLLFLWSVPMLPSSDQKVVCDIAITDLTDLSGYMVVNVNVIPTILYVYVALLGSKSLWIPKIVNMILGLVTLMLTAKIYGLLSDDTKDLSKESKQLFTTNESQMLWFGAIFLPAFFYNNHIYNEVPAAALSILMLYLVIRNDDAVWIKAVTIMVSCLQFVLRQSGVILVIAVAMYIFFYQKKRIYALVYFIAVIAGYLLIEKWYTLAMVGDGARGYPVWSFIRMGMNEAEFGFQDNSHQSDFTFWDCVDRYKEYGPLKVLTIFCKKTFWIWGEGTYQSGRYGLGYPDNAYVYETFVTNKISGSANRKLRIIANIVLRAQYLFYMFFALVGTYRAKDKPKYSIFFFIVCGFFLFFLIWEIKSRYLYGLYPVFLVLALRGWNEHRDIIFKFKRCSLFRVKP